MSKWVWKISFDSQGVKGGEGQTAGSVKWSSRREMLARDEVRY